MQNIEFDLDTPNINDILEEKVQINSIFNFSLFQNVLEEFIKRQNIMNKKLNSLEFKFNSWSLINDEGGNTEISNKVEPNKIDINQNEPEKNIKDEINENEDINEKVKKINKKVKKLELLTREIEQKLIIINVDGDENIENDENNNNNNEKNDINIKDDKDEKALDLNISDEKIKQIFSNIKNLENKLKEKERIINNQANKMNQLIKKIELIELNEQENKQTLKNINTDIFNLQKLKLEDLVNEFYKFKNQNDKETKDLKNLIDKKIEEDKNNLEEKNNQESNNQEEKIKMASYINDNQLEEMSSELKTFVTKNLSEMNKSFKKIIEELNIEKINKDILDIRNELNEKLTSKNLTALNIRIEDMDSKIIDFNSQMIEFRQSFDYLNEHSGKVDKNIEFLSMNLNRLTQDEPKKEEKNNKINRNINNENEKNFVKKDKYEQEMTKMLKKIEKVLLFQQDNNKKIEDFEEKMKNFASDKDIKNIEHYTLNMIQEFKINAIKKFMDKKEGNKSLRLLGLQIKNINEYLNINNSNVSFDKIYSNNVQYTNFCPSCETKITSQINNHSKENAPNRSREKQENQNYRMGQGFSHMLKLLNFDIMRSAEKVNDLNIKIEDNAKNTHEIFKGSSLENKSLPRLNSQKSFSLLNAEAKNSELDSSNNNNISGNYYDSTLKNLKNNTIDRVVTKKSDIKNKMFRNIEKNLSWKENKNQNLISKIKK